MASVEIDQEQVREEVVQKLIHLLYPEVRRMAEQAVKDEAVPVVKARAREHFEALLTELRFSDGKDFKQFLEELILRPNATGYGFHKGPRLVVMIESWVHQSAQRLFAEIAKPYFEEAKKKLIEAVASLSNP